MQKGKFMIIGLSLILVVAVAIGLIVGVNNHHKSSSGDDGGGSSALSSTSKAVASVCAVTDFKGQCVNSLSSLANNQSATPKDFLQAVIQVAIQEVEAAMQSSSWMKKAANDSLNQMAADDCKDLLDSAIDELQASFSSVGDSQLHTISDREDELKNWLSAVISYQQTCVDGFTQPDLKNSISNGLLNASQITDNALAILSAMSQIVAAFNISFPATATTSTTNDDANNAATSRRLLDDSNYPHWLSAADRHLLAAPSNGMPTPNAVVAKDGSGQYKTIGEALAAYPKNSIKGSSRYIIYVKEGVYEEYVLISKDQINVFIYGDGPRKTRVTGNKSFAGGVSTFKTATFSAIGNGFIAKSMGFANTAGPQGHQAVALRVQSDMAAIYNCRIDGYQDTLYAQTHRQFYRNCVISGTIDFVFGDSSVIIQNSLIIVRKPMDNQQNTVTAHGRAYSHEDTGLVIQNCKIVPEQILEPVRFKIPSYLGRPWKQYSRAVIMESTLGDFIHPDGWMPWAGSFALDTCYFAEYANRGPGAVTSKRVRWKGYHVITNKNEALQFTAAPFIQGNQWLKLTGAPYSLSLIKN